MTCDGYLCHCETSLLKSRKWSIIILQHVLIIVLTGSACIKHIFFWQICPAFWSIAAFLYTHKNLTSLFVWGLICHSRILHRRATFFYRTNFRYRPYMNTAKYHKTKVGYKMSNSALLRCILTVTWYHITSRNEAMPAGFEPVTSYMKFLCHGTNAYMYTRMETK